MENNGGTGGIVVCLGVGGLVDLGALLGVEGEDNETSYGGVEVPVEEGLEPTSQPRVENGKIQRGYKRGMGGIIVFDDGDIEDDLEKEQDAYMALLDMPEVDDNGDSGGSDTESEDEEQEPQSRPGQKRKSWSDRDDEDESDEDADRPRQRRKSNRSSPIPDSPTRPKQRGLLSLNGPPESVAAVSRSVSPTPAQPPKGPSTRTLRRRLLKLRRKNESVLQAYYSLASELGREDNDLLWMAIVGVTSMELSCGYIWKVDDCGLGMARDKRFADEATFTRRSSSSQSSRSLGLQLFLESKHVA
ncbi:putative Cell division control protein 45 like protein [Glarea lozoyensis 74030]|uniref:Putative Cell division control protein 45 like protein n=1 Tax=Glarea lozoyensis (strain ATCC 74030 / MF5533) TaxID=1104152 RepID=H0EEJ8_GLAL7|nr:putative Cell division control protein 45 like protein [Glarea lozoyensis 74030]